LGGFTGSDSSGCSAPGGAATFTGACAPSDGCRRLYLPPRDRLYRHL